MANSGHKLVTTAGIAEALGDQDIMTGLIVKALTTNTGLIYIGNDGSGDVDSSNGYPLAAGGEVEFEFVGNLAQIMINSTVNGEGVAWLITWA
jgi:hypothetical protein